MRRNALRLCERPRPTTAGFFFLFIWYRFGMRSSLVIPLALVIAGTIIAGGVYYFFNGSAQNAGLQNLSVIRPVDDTDHILGNPAAAVKFVEYSDVDCPFCKNFKDTMESVMATYGAGGNVAWVYRHLPVTDQHPNAQAHAEASECIAAEGGTSAFFKFIDALNAAAPGTTQFDPTKYGPVVEKMGLDTSAFTTCLTNHTYQKRVADEAANALAAGAGGTPFTVILIKGQPPVSISGAFSLSQMKQITDEALAKAGVK
jgi:protein-disulfide isomerase